MRNGDLQATMLRHRPGTRIAHAALALCMIVLIVSGLGMSGRLPGSIVSGLGGHVSLGSLHRQLGVVFGIVVAPLLLFGPAAARRLVADMCRFRRGEFAWFGSFAAYCLAPRRHRPSFHSGRFDPGQRIVFTLMLGAGAVLTGSAAALYLAPAGPRPLLAWAVRIHIAAAVIFIFALVLHIVVGAGLLASHRNIGRVIFGDGRVRQCLAQTLWPAWTARQATVFATKPTEQAVGMAAEAAPGPQPGTATAKASRADGPHRLG